MQQYPARLIAFSLVSRYFCRRGFTNEIYQRVIHAKDCLFCQTNILNYWHFLPYYFGKCNHILGRLSSNEEKIGIGREDHGIFNIYPRSRPAIRSLWLRKLISWHDLQIPSWRQDTSVHNIMQTRRGSGGEWKETLRRTVHGLTRDSVASESEVERRISTWPLGNDDHRPLSTLFPHLLSWVTEKRRVFL